MLRTVFVFCAGLLAVSLAQTATAAPANEYNDRNFNDRIKTESLQPKSNQGAAYKYNDRSFEDRVKPQRFGSWGSKTNQSGGDPLAAITPGTPKSGGGAALPEGKKPTIKTHKTDPETLRKQAKRPTPPKRELSYRPWDAYDPKEQLPPPPKVK